MQFIRLNPVWNFFEPCRFSESAESERYNPSIDILEDPKSIVFNAELPGVGRDSINVSVNDDNILTIKGEKKQADSDNVNNCCCNERQFGEFSRSFRLPDNIDSTRIDANYDNGVLQVIINKIEPVKPKVTDIAIN